MLLSALFSGMEIAFVSSNKLRIEIDKNKGKLSGKFLSVFNNNAPKFIAMLLLGNNIALVIYGVYMEQILTNPIKRLLPESLSSDFFQLILETIITTVLILMFSEFLPKVLFKISPNRL
jgi:CBS domain containing-hemolysin-like protein